MKIKLFFLLLFLLTSLNLLFSQTREIKDGQGIKKTGQSAIQEVSSGKKQKKILDIQSESIFKENKAIKLAVDSLNTAISSSKRHDIINVRMNNFNTGGS